MFNIPLIDLTYKKSGKKCRFTHAKEPVSFFTPLSFGLAKNGPYTQACNKKYFKFLKFVNYRLIY